MKKFFTILAILSLCTAAFALDVDVVFDEGVSYAQVTRVEKLTDRSNFVRENMMIGAFFTTKTVGLPLVDEWHMNYLGLGLTIGFELPVSPGWTIINRNFVSLDNPNLGQNKNIQKFEGCYSYHINLGVRYSRRVRNEYSYIKGAL